MTAIPSFQRVTENPFLFQHQGGFEKKRTVGQSFCLIPREIVEKIGYQSNRGARLELMALSCLVWHSKITDTETTETLQYHNGNEIAIENTFVLSRASIAEDVYKCLTGYDIPSIYTTDEGKAFYAQIVNCINRLTKNGYISEVEKIGVKGVFGTRWVIGNWIEGHTEKCTAIAQNAISGSFFEREEVDVDSRYIDITAPTRKVFLGRQQRFTVTEIIASINSRGTHTDYETAVNLFASTPHNGERYTTVGATEYAPDGTISDNVPVQCPDIVLDIDRSELEEAHESAVRICEQLESDGVALTQITVAFSGSKGFHVRIPQEHFGSPTFRNADAGRESLIDWSRLYLEENVDTATLNPKQPIRCVGTVNNKSGLYCTGFTGDEFMSLSLTEIVEQARSFTRYRFPNRANIKPNAELVMSLINATHPRFYIPTFSEALKPITGNGIMKAINAGIGEGEMFGNHCGRNKAAFIKACRLIDDNLGFSDLEAWNQLNTPPLPNKDLQSCFRSAQRRLNRQYRTN